MCWHARVETKKKPGTMAGTEPLRASFREVKRGGFKPEVNLSQSIKASHRVHSKVANSAMDPM